MYYRNIEPQQIFIAAVFLYVNVENENFAKRLLLFSFIYFQQNF